MTAKLFLLALCINASFAFWFQRQTPVATADDRAIEQSCIDHGQQGDCEFYSCFERRLPCGRDWYMTKHGHYYCNKMEARRPNFSPEGQQFLDDVRQCLTQALIANYSRDYVDCHDLEHFAVDAVVPCFNEHGFCDILQTDAEEFFHVYEIGDLFTRGSAKLWRTMLQLSTSCGAQYARRFSNQAAEGIMGALNGMFESLGDSLTNYVNDNN